MTMSSRQLESFNHEGQPLGSIDIPRIVAKAPAPRPALAPQPVVTRVSFDLPLLQASMVAAAAGPIVVAPRELPVPPDTPEELAGWPSMLVAGAENPVFDTITILDGATLDGPVVVNGPLTLEGLLTVESVVISGGLTVGGDATFGGQVTLFSDPTQPLQAATKRYVDAQDALLLPLTGGSLSGPLSVTGGAVSSGIAKTLTLQSPTAAPALVLQSRANAYTQWWVEDYVGNFYISWATAAGNWSGDALNISTTNINFRLPVTGNGLVTINAPASTNAWSNFAPGLNLTSHFGEPSIAIGPWIGLGSTFTWVIGRSSDALLIGSMPAVGAAGTESDNAYFYPDGTSEFISAVTFDTSIGMSNTTDNTGGIQMGQGGATAIIYTNFATGSFNIDVNNANKLAMSSTDMIVSETIRVIAPDNGPFGYGADIFLRSSGTYGDGWGGIFWQDAAATPGCVGIVSGQAASTLHISYFNGLDANAGETQLLTFGPSFIDSWITLNVRSGLNAMKSGGGTNAGVQVTAAGNATYTWNDTSAPVNAKKWDLLASNGTMYGRLLLDDESNFTTWITVARTGDTASQISFGGPVTTPGPLTVQNANSAATGLTVGSASMYVPGTGTYTGMFTMDFDGYGDGLHFDVNNFVMNCDFTVQTTSNFLISTSNPGVSASFAWWDTYHSTGAGFGVATGRGGSHLVIGPGNQYGQITDNFWVHFWPSPTPQMQVSCPAYFPDVHTSGNLSPHLVAAASDAAAATAGVPVGALYQNAGVVQVRLV